MEKAPRATPSDALHCVSRSILRVLPRGLLGAVLSLPCFLSTRIRQLCTAGTVFRARNDDIDSCLVILTYSYRHTRRVVYHVECTTSSGTRAAFALYQATPSTAHCVEVLLWRLRAGEYYKALRAARIVAFLRLPEMH